MRAGEVATLRLRAQQLVGGGLATPAEVVALLCAVQAQDPAGAAWALGLRTRSATRQEFDRSFDAGQILRTHVLRPTWHYVLPDEVGWLLELTAPRLRRSLAGRYRRLELDSQTITRALELFTGSLAGGGHLTRADLGGVLDRAGISTAGQRLPHLLMAAELAGVLVSGARQGRQHTYALLAQRAPRARQLDRDQALGELTARYFGSRGPARLIDFAWWSGLTISDIRRGLAVAAPLLARVSVDGDEHWMAEDVGEVAASRVPIAHLLPNFDELTVAYRDRSALRPPATTPGESGLATPAEPTSSIDPLGNVVAIDGTVRGAWRLLRSARRPAAELELVGAPDNSERAALAAAGMRYAEFVQQEVELRIRTGPVPAPPGALSDA